MRLKKIPGAPNSGDLSVKQHALLRAAREEITIARRALEKAGQYINAATHLATPNTMPCYSLLSVCKILPSPMEDTEAIDRRLTKWIGKHSFYEREELLNGKR